MNRYARQSILAEIGAHGQAQLENASVLCIGAGGLGSPALMYLAAAGVGHIGIIDSDHVELTNLHRQVLFKEKDLHASKAMIAQKVLQEQNSAITVTAYQERFSHHNAETLVKKYDIILDGTDNFYSKFLINDACVKYQKPMVYGAILGFEAQVSVFWAKKGPCYRCLYAKPPSVAIPNCAEAGVIGAIAGLAGSLQALEVIKLILQQDALKILLGRLWMMDAKTMESQILTIPKNANCNICSVPSGAIILTPPQSVDLQNAVVIDVRELHELSGGMIEKAIHIPLQQLLERNDWVKSFPEYGAIIVYCQHEGRSQRGVAHLRQIGFTNVRVLRGGFAHYVHFQNEGERKSIVECNLM